MQQLPWLWSSFPLSQLCSLLQGLSSGGYYLGVRRNSHFETGQPIARLISCLPSTLQGQKNKGRDAAAW